MGPVSMRDDAWTFPEPGGAASTMICGAGADATSGDAAFFLKAWTLSADADTPAISRASPSVQISQRSSRLSMRSPVLPSSISRRSS